MVRVWVLVKLSFRDFNIPAPECLPFLRIPYLVHVWVAETDKFDMVPPVWEAPCCGCLRLPHSVFLVRVSVTSVSFFFWYRYSSSPSFSFFFCCSRDSFLYILYNTFVFWHSFTAWEWVSSCTRFVEKYWLITRFGHDRRLVWYHEGAHMLEQLRRKEGCVLRTKKNGGNQWEGYGRVQEMDSTIAGLQNGRASSSIYVTYGYSQPSTAILYIKPISSTS